MTEVRDECIKWTSRAPSGFYTLIEDELIGPGKLYVYDPAYGQIHPPKVLRTFGIIWDHIPDRKVRMFIYEPRPFPAQNLDVLDKAIQSAFSFDRIDSFPPPSLQHNFAGVNGLVADQVSIWNFENEAIILTDTVQCDKFILEKHFVPISVFNYDLHVRIALREPKVLPSH